MNSLFEMKILISGELFLMFMNIFYLLYFQKILKYLGKKNER
jgi:hypothetical protein